MIAHMIVVVDSGATSFCYYENPAYGHPGSELIPQTTLEQVVDYASEHALSVNFIYGQRPLPSSHEALIEQVAHVRIVPLPLLGHHSDAVIVVNPADLEQLDLLSPRPDRNVILRIDRSQLTHLPRLFERLDGKCARLALVIKDLDQLSDDDIVAYGVVLRRVGEQLTARYVSGQSFELSVLSDRLMLSQMRNCNAGLEHFTVGPNGQCYLCPGFLHNSDQEYLSGNLQSGLQYRNPKLLEIARAPICRTCDAYQCKRCLFLNKQTTLEINTPSRQQCAAAHIEREASRELRESLVSQDSAFGVFETIAQLDSLDPLERHKAAHSVTRKVTYPGLASMKGHSETPHDPSTRELLLEILRNQEEILALLRSRGPAS